MVKRTVGLTDQTHWPASYGTEPLPRCNTNSDARRHFILVAFTTKRKRHRHQPHSRTVLHFDPQIWIDQQEAIWELIDSIATVFYHKGVNALVSMVSWQPHTLARVVLEDAGRGRTEEEENLRPWIISLVIFSKTRSTVTLSHAPTHLADVPPSINLTALIGTPSK